MLHLCQISLLFSCLRLHAYKWWKPSGKFYLQFSRAINAKERYGSRKEHYMFQHLEPKNSYNMRHPIHWCIFVKTLSERGSPGDGGTWVSSPVDPKSIIKFSMLWITSMFYHRQRYFSSM